MFPSENMYNINCITSDPLVSRGESIVCHVHHIFVNLARAGERYHKSSRTHIIAAIFTHTIDYMLLESNKDG